MRGFAGNLLRSDPRLAGLIRYIPGWDILVTRYCKIGNARKSGRLSGVINALFAIEYFSRPLADRVRIQGILMGGSAGQEWADYYDRDRDIFPPVGQKKIGVLPWEDADPSVSAMNSILTKNPSGTAVIQLGASSGKEIGYYAKKYPSSDFVYSEMCDKIVEHASTKLVLENLKYVTCPAEFLCSIADVSSASRVVVLSSGSSQYVYPEHLDSLFRGLARIRGKQVYFVLIEPGDDRRCPVDEINGSLPRGNFSYTHNYKFYAEKHHFSVEDWRVIRPYPEGSAFSSKKSTVHLYGVFVKHAKD